MNLTFQLVEAFNGFYLYHKGECACLGDGTDRESEFELGTEDFRLEWVREIREDWETYKEAYFRGV